ncbi:hypothetical protein FGG08_001949 [Glutinoglossum americanum]|uniref:SURF1-like protein n=1 Tax=Glutinoglossum americanum TaxID=1670608 RepID=A0A9P8KZP2_9PEZI|nr:hypothetical protein FGG08_001949 [Glutinoglossum americanum]
MNVSGLCLRQFNYGSSTGTSQRLLQVLRNGQACPKCVLRYRQQNRFSHSPADDPNFSSIVDNPPTLVRAGRRHGRGLIILALVPITAFALGTWQVQRLGWKTKLIAKFEDRLVREPLPLPPQVNPDAISEFDYRRVYATGRLRHDQEMLIGPRIREGENGYLVITPLEREGNAGTILVNRGWIPKKLKRQPDRKEGLPDGEVTISGLLREPWKKNLFTPDNRPELGEFYFPDVQQMANLTGSQPVWVEETMDPDLLKDYDRKAKGIPIGRPAEINLINNHVQYIFTCYFSHAMDGGTQTPARHSEESPTKQGVAVKMLQTLVPEWK